MINKMLVQNVRTLETFQNNLSDCFIGLESTYSNSISDVDMGSPSVS